MARFFISSLKIEGFRGINNNTDPLEIRFKPDAVNSIHAPNGVGKTSIFEAIYYAIFGTVPRLTDLQATEQPDSYIINQFHSRSKAHIQLVFTPDDGASDIEIVVEYNTGTGRTVSSPSGYSDPEGFLSTLQEDFALVDYKKFTDFIENSALNRGRSFASLIGLTRYSRLRQALEGVKDTRAINNDFGIRTLETEVARLEREVDNAKTQAIRFYGQITGESISALEDIDRLCTSISAVLQTTILIKPAIENEDIRDVDFHKVEQIIEQAEGGPLRKRLTEVTQAVSALQSLIEGEQEQDERIAILQLATQRDTAMLEIGSPLLRKLYETASQILGDSTWGDPSICPVCESRSDEDLAERINRLLGFYESVDDANRQLSIKVSGSAVFDRLRRMEICSHMEISPTDHVYANTIQLSKGGNLTTVEIQKAFANLDSFDSQLTIILERYKTEKAEIEGELPQSLVNLTKQVSATQRFCEQIGAYVSKYESLQERQAQLHIRTRWRNFITQASDAFSAAEFTLTNERIGEIQTVYQALFGDLMRGSHNLQPTLERAVRTENVDLKLSDFHGLQNINARAVLSESYRNALAASIFFAAAVRHNGAPRFMVLDDITSSFDAGHQFSLMEAIRTQLQHPANPQGLQFIILSHDTALEKYFDTQNGTTAWHHQKLQGMSPTGAVMLSSQQGDRLKQKAEFFLNAGDIDSGAPLVRQYLEFKLSHIIAKLQILVPPDYVTRGDRRTLSTCIDAITNAIELFDRAGTCVLEAQQINAIKTTHVPFIMSNCVSHYETGVGTPYSAGALLGVLNNIENLINCFTYLDTTQSPPQKKFYKRLDKRY